MKPRRRSRTCSSTEPTRREGPDRGAVRALTHAGRSAGTIKQRRAEAGWAGTAQPGRRESEAADYQVGDASGQGQPLLITELIQVAKVLMRLNTGLLEFGAASPQLPPQE